MGHRHLWMLLTGVGAIALAGLGYELRMRQDAAALCERALRLLHQSAAESPDLTHVQAEQARMLLDDALAIRDSETTQGLRHLASAYAYLQKGELERAASRVNLAEQRIGITADSAHLRAELAEREGKPQDAMRHARAALRLSPHHVRAEMLLADLHMLMGDPAEALHVLDTIISVHGTAATLENRRGVALEALEDLDGARRAFEHATRMDGRLYQGHLNLARRLRADGDSERALLTFIEAQKRAPNDVSPLIGMGLCRLSMGDTEGAEADLEQAARLSKVAEPTLLLAMGDLSLHRRDLVMAVEHYEAAVTAAPDLAIAQLKLGNTLMLLGRRSDAVDRYRAAIALESEFAAAHNGLGAALLALHETEEAALALGQAAALDPRDPNPLLNLARLHRSLGDEAQAEAALAAARERDPSVHLASLTKAR